MLEFTIQDGHETILEVCFELGSGMILCSRADWEDGVRTDKDINCQHCLSEIKAIVSFETRNQSWFRWVMNSRFLS